MEETLENTQEIVIEKTQETKIFNCTPPIILERNSYGLLTTTNYVFDPITGLIDWRKLIKPEFIVPNKQKTQETDVSKLDDSKLLILLAGLKELAQVRGFSKLKSRVRYTGLEAATVETQIKWLPNYETFNLSVVSTGIATATLHNTESFTKNFLSEMAENRSFARCIRNFLRIHICSQEEIGPKNGNNQEACPENNTTYQKLQSLMDEKGVTLERILKKCVDEKVDGAEDFKKIQDIPKDIVFDLIGKLKKYKNA